MKPLRCSFFFSLFSPPLSLLCSALLARNPLNSFNLPRYREMLAKLAVNTERVNIANYEVVAKRAAKLAGLAYDLISGAAR